VAANMYTSDSGLRESTSIAPDIPVIAVMGNPNTGKSVLFNALTGMKQKVANYPGVTVDWHEGTAALPGTGSRLIDLPGTYSLTPHSPDEVVAVDILLGHMDSVSKPDAVLLVVDSTNLQRNFYLATQLMEIGLPIVMALNMSDMAQARGLVLDLSKLQQRLGMVVVPTSATKGHGIQELRSALAQAVKTAQPTSLDLFPVWRKHAQLLHDEFAGKGQKISSFELERALMDEDGLIEKRLVERFGVEMQNRLEQIREPLKESRPIAAIEARVRYGWIKELLGDVIKDSPQVHTMSERIDTVINHPVAGIMIFFLVMALVFQAVFAWSAPLMDLVDSGAGWLGSVVSANLPEGALQSLLVDGVIAGVGSIIIFLPQIIILSAFIVLLEDSGYMARAAFFMDRVMRLCGLSGQSFIPMLTSFACAVPGIMATRVIPDRRDRLATIISAPFMTCAARLPVYTLLISAFVPQQRLYGWVNVQGLVLFGLYILGIVAGIATAYLVKRVLLRGPSPTFLMEMPPYRWPNLLSLVVRMRDRSKMFVVRAGTVMFSVAVVIWGLAYFPRAEDLEQKLETDTILLQQVADEEERAERVQELAAQFAAAQIEQSYLGRLGRVVEPVFSPLGWDWRISAAVIASFPAREVVIGVLGTIFAVGDEDSSTGLKQRVHQAVRADGTPLFNLPVALGLIIFYAFCLQCIATIVIIYRETGSWKWPAFAWTYMTALGYLGAFLCVQLL